MLEYGGFVLEETAGCESGCELKVVTRELVSSFGEDGAFLFLLVYRGASAKKIITFKSEREEDRLRQIKKKRRLET